METTTDDQPPRKRARQSGNDEEATTSNQTTSTSTPVTRSPDFWYIDGSIVLHAESTQFRVHHSILSQNSTVFRDIFEVPQPNHGEPMVEGCLIVHVSDSAQDIAHMLASLYDRTRSKDMRPSFARVSAMLRLGKKYDIEYQHQAALEILQAELPSSAILWRNKEPKAVGKYIKDEPELLFHVINLALETNTLSILPAAYLLLNYEQSSEHIAGGLRRKDGSYLTIPPGAQLACLVGRDRLLTKVINKCFYWLPTGAFDPEYVMAPGDDDCDSQDACLLASYRLGTEILQKPMDPCICFNKLSNLIAFNSLCEDCRSSALADHLDGCIEMWGDLPLDFGLPPWADILR